MIHLRARAAVRLLSQIRDEDPILFGKIREFKESHRLSPNELWDCANCFNTESLNVHGRCKRCGSEAVSPNSLQKAS